ncbi:MAG: SMODS domain-containing nucleotidyltransferase [Nanoarchaeota archaeon]
MKNNLRKTILSNIKPNIENKKEKQDIVHILLKELNKQKKLLNYNCTFFIGGSFGKDTDLKDTSDIDIFAKFDTKYDDDKISNMLEKIIIKSKFQYSKQKGSRDYFNLEFKQKKFSIKIEIVPVLNIINPKLAKNSTDVSPLHVDFIKKKIAKNPNLKNEIRLAKQFFKSKKIYGAESYINGFSGHSIDILICYYNTLESLLNDAKTWKQRKFIDINNFYESYQSALIKIPSSKISSLILVDPILETRNAARALSVENYSKFLVIAKNFDELRESDFTITKFNLHKTIKSAKKIAKRNKLSNLFYVFNLDVNNHNNSQDIIGSKLLRLNSKLAHHFTEYDFQIFNNEFFIDFSQKTCLFVFFLEHKNIPKLKKIMGPFVYMDSAFHNFIKDKKYYFIKDSRVYSYQERKITNINQISNLTKEDCKKMLNKNVEFIKKIKIISYN